MNDHWKRLRERAAASTTRKDGIYTVVGCPPCTCPVCTDDLSILTDFDEALDALERFVPLTKGMGFGGMDSKFDRENAQAVLAKAGRR